MTNGNQATQQGRDETAGCRERAKMCQLNSRDTATLPVSREWEAFRNGVMIPTPTCYWLRLSLTEARIERDVWLQLVEQGQDQNETS